MRKQKKRRAKVFIIGLPILILIGTVFLFLIGTYISIDKFYQEKIFPAVMIDHISFSGKTPSEVTQFWNKRSEIFDKAQFTFSFEGMTATVSGTDLDLEYDATLSAYQAYSIGRSPSFFSNINFRFFTQEVNLPPSFRWDNDALSIIISSFSSQLNEQTQDALFQFENGKVTAFKPSKPGKAVNENEAKKLFEASLGPVANGRLKQVFIPIQVDTLPPKVKTDDVNTFGIKERIGYGHSVFAGSIPGRIHNVALAASKFNGVLIKPGDVFSFNKTVGDISAATGYQSAYIIKDGRTVMGDGGGVCQVSTTLFRALLNAGLPVIERHEHSYRVHYYEDGGYKAGLDATVFDPTDDLKFKNDTPGYILIQTATDIPNTTLVFELYGTNDGRKSEILNHKVWGISPPPPDVYQDDPTLPVGTIKQVDFAAWGANASFDYKVTRNNETLFAKTFKSTYRPWQAVFLKGTKQ